MRGGACDFGPFSGTQADISTGLSTDSGDKEPLKKCIIYPHVSCRNKMNEHLDPKPLRRGRTGYETGAAVLREHLKRLPGQPGVYRMIAQSGSVLYVGKAKNLKK